MFNVPWSAGTICVLDPYLVITVPADGLAPNGARPSAGTVLTIQSDMFFQSWFAYQIFWKCFWWINDIFKTANEIFWSNPAICVLIELSMCEVVYSTYCILHSWFQNQSTHDSWNWHLTKLNSLLPSWDFSDILHDQFESNFWSNTKKIHEIFIESSAVGSLYIQN